MISANFITGLSDSPPALAVKDNTLFVSDYDSIGKYDATTGAVIKADFITGLGEVGGLAVFGSEEKAVLFVTDRNEDGGGTVGEYDANTGFTINRHFITGLDFPTGIAVKSAK